MKEPLKTAVGTFKCAQNLFFLVEGQNYSGIGEAAPTPLITGDNQEGAFLFLTQVKKLLAGREVTSIAEIHALLDSVSLRQSSAKGAVDIALYDIWAQSISLPLYKALGGSPRKIRTDITISKDSPEKMVDKALLASEEGNEYIKLKIGSGEKDIERVKRIRKELDVNLRLDANQGYTPKKAVKILNEVTRFEIELVEQPVPSWDIDGLRYVKNHVEIPIFADESVHSPHDAIKVVKNMACDGINIKLMKCGGILNAIKIANIAQAGGLQLMIGCMIESNVSITAAAHLGFAIKDIEYVDLDSPQFLEEDPSIDGMRVEKGFITLPEDPGLGVHMKFP